MRTRDLDRLFQRLERTTERHHFVRSIRAIRTEPWWLDTAQQHADAEKRCGRKWTATSGCACGACRAARAENWTPDTHR